MKKTIATLWVFAASFVLVTSVMMAEANAQILDRPLSFRELTHELQTPEDVAHFMWRHFRFETDRANFGQEEYWQSPQEFLANGKGDCEDFAVFAQEILKSKGIPAFVLNIYGSGGYAHTICVFKENGRYSAIDGSRVLNFRSKSINELVSNIYPFWKKGAVVTANHHSAQGEIIAQFAKQAKARRHLTMSA
ncbi:MAG: transglutaminase-like cysteine peptidase [Candidatus Omnitrophica bacterium]|nr:transglutaminase-like cysteine peptidase [Candidatus Omnitrophota bacterium]